jgi:Ser/Thr protein kinase RdoA (MazF antagonist)
VGEAMTSDAGAATPAVGAALPPGSAVRRFATRMYTRSGLDQMASHLDERYGIEVAGISELDLGVLRIDRRDGPRWVARLFPAARSADRATGDAAILQHLASQAGGAFPAERCATPDPVSELDGQALVVTGYVESVTRAQRAETIRQHGGLRRLGELLGRLQTLPATDGPLGRSGGCWHHLADGGPTDEVAALAALVDAASELVSGEARSRYESLRAEVASLDGCDGLPEAFVHPDFVLANVVASSEQGMVLVDWAGAGRAARVWPLAWLLFVEGGKDLARVDRVVAGYRSRVVPEPEELARLAAVMRVRPTVLATWAFCMGRSTLEETLSKIAGARELAAATAAGAAGAFAHPA